MKILKKIAGFLLLAIGLILSFAAFFTMIKGVFIDSVKEINESKSEGIAYLLGTLFFGFLIVLLIRFIFKSGIKLIKPKKIQGDPIEEIGKA